MALDVDALRADTPGCANVTHLNHAGASLPPSPVLAAVVDHLVRESEIGGYEAAAEAADRLQAVYEGIARLIGATADEIALVDSGTRAWDMAFYAMRFEPGDEILTAKAEYASNVISFLQVAERTGAVIRVVPDEPAGQLSVGALESMVGPRTRLIAVTHVPTQGGLVNPAEEIGAVARRHAVPYLLDACQSVGQMPIDVEAIGCDVLTAPGRKFLRGPRGTAFLYVRRSLIGQLDPPFLDLWAATWVADDRYEIRADARRFETWESSAAGRLGLGAAVGYALDVGLDAIEARILELAAGLRERLAALPSITQHDVGERRCGIVTFTDDRHSAQEVAARLRAAGVNVSVTLSSYARWDLEARGLPDLVRASVHCYNTEDELDRLAEALR